MAKLKVAQIISEWLLPGASKDPESITKDWQPAERHLIDGVTVHEVRPVMTGYGHLTEIFRREWLEHNSEVGQIFASYFHPGAASGWHAHAQTTDRIFAVTSQFRLVLFDARQDSPTHGTVNEFLFGEQRPMLIVVPPRVWHGVQNYGATSAVLLNAVDQAYRYDDPDHWRLPLDSSEIPYRFPAARTG